MIANCVGIYGGIIALSLFGFAAHQLFQLGLANWAGNEEIRQKWNAAPKNKESAEIYKRDSGCLAKCKYHLFGKLPESRLHKYSKLVDLYEKAFGNGK